MSSEAELDGIPSFDITVTAENLQDDLFEVYKLLFKDITSKDEVEFEELQGGYINSIYRIFLKADKSKSLVFRTFGMKFNAGQFQKSIADTQASVEQETKGNDKDANNNVEEKAQEKSEGKAEEKQEGKAEEKAEEPNADAAKDPSQEAPDFEKILFSRLTEYKVMHEVSKHQLCQKVYGRYKNGIVYGFAPGVTLNGALMLTNDFLEEAARKMAKFHSIKFEVPGIPFKTHYDRVFDQMGQAFTGMLNAVDEKLAAINEFPYNVMPSSKLLAEYEERMKKVLTGLGFGRIVFCHNDANQKNLIWSPQERSLSFIDFEMTMNNYQVFDLGYLFGCYPGHFLYSFEKSFFPSNDYRRSFLKRYLQEFNRLNSTGETKGDEFEAELEDLYHRVNLTTLMHLVRLAMIGGFFDLNPSMFKNEELRVARESDKYFCGKYSYKVYKLFEENYESLVQEAEKYLESKNAANKSEA